VAVCALQSDRGNGSAAMGPAAAAVAPPAQRLDNWEQRFRHALFFVCVTHNVTEMQTMDSSIENKTNIVCAIATRPNQVGQVAAFGLATAALASSARIAASWKSSDLMRVGCIYVLRAIVAAHHLRVMLAKPSETNRRFSARTFARSSFGRGGAGQD